MSKEKVNIFWFRRDLRIEDNTGLYHALKAGLPVVPVFIFDRNILDELEDKADRRVEFIHQSLNEIQRKLLKKGTTMDIRYGYPVEIFRELLKDYSVRNVFTNHDYEPYARERDEAVASLLAKEEVKFHHYKDQVIFEKDEIVKRNGDPYTVFTPYSRTWKAALEEKHWTSKPGASLTSHFFRQPERDIVSLEEMGFEPSGKPFPSAEWEESQIEQYEKRRDYPALKGTTRLSVHLRFGTISIRELVRQVKDLSDTFLNELIWREFYQVILWHFPEVVHKSFKPVYDKIQWVNNEKEFDAWCNGNTGYPIVDAGMRELNETGFMHNRLRMITASFLTKHLLIDWRWGEAYFARKLLDYELASNNGGWQWAAGSGCDAVPYFRIFNPYLQAKKFDPHNQYIRKWVPEFESEDYSPPIVVHEEARKRCLAVYAKAVKK